MPKEGGEESEWGGGTKQPRYRTFYRMRSQHLVQQQEMSSQMQHVGTQPNEINGVGHIDVG